MIPCASAKGLDALKKAAVMKEKDHCSAESYCAAAPDSVLFKKMLLFYIKQR